MAVIGLGTDIVEIARITRSTEKGPALAKRVLTHNELVRYEQSHQPSRYLAKRFAAKEAAAKALGTGIGRGVSFQHMEIDNDENGAPFLILSAGALQRMHTLGAERCFISIADEQHYATATVILESVC